MPPVSKLEINMFSEDLHRHIWHRFKLTPTLRPRERYPEEEYGPTQYSTDIGRAVTYLQFSHRKTLFDYFTKNFRKTISDNTKCLSGIAISMMNELVSDTADPLFMMLVSSAMFSEIAIFMHSRGIATYMEDVPDIWANYVWVNHLDKFQKIGGFEALKTSCQIYLCIDYRIDDLVRRYAHSYNAKTASKILAKMAGVRCSLLKCQLAIVESEVKSEVNKKDDSKEVEPVQELEVLEIEADLTQEEITCLEDQRVPPILSNYILPSSPSTSSNQGSETRIENSPKGPRWKTREKMRSKRHSVHIKKQESAPLLETGTRPKEIKVFVGSPSNETMCGQGPSYRDSSISPRKYKNRYEEISNPENYTEIMDDEISQSSSESSSKKQTNLSPLSPIKFKIKDCSDAAKQLKSPEKPESSDRLSVSQIISKEASPKSKNPKTSPVHAFLIQKQEHKMKQLAKEYNQMYPESEAGRKSPFPRLNELLNSSFSGNDSASSEPNTSMEDSAIGDSDSSDFQTGIESMINQLNIDESTNKPVAVDEAMIKPVSVQKSPRKKRNRKKSKK